MRVPMPSKPANWIAEGDDMLRVSLSPTMGRRFSMDINETVLAQIGARALEHAVKVLGEHVAHEHMPAIQGAIDAFLFDKSWICPIIEDELRHTVRDFVLSLWNDEEKRNLRDWFDVFSAKCRPEPHPATNAVDPSAQPSGTPSARVSSSGSED